MTTTCHFAEELRKVAFSMVPAIPTSAMGKTTKGVIAKPLTTLKMPTVKTPSFKVTKSVSVSSGKSIGTKIDPARASTPPPPIRGGSNVQ